MGPLTGDSTNLHIRGMFEEPVITYSSSTYNLNLQRVGTSPLRMTKEIWSHKVSTIIEVSLHCTSEEFPLLKRADGPASEVCQSPTAVETPDKGHSM